MSNIDKQALRQLAVDAKELAIIKRYTKGIEAQKKFIAEMTPSTVLALLDELEAKDRRNAELNSTLERWATDRAQSASELDDAENRIAEQQRSLDHREFLLLSADQVQREYAEALGCAGDNESILEAIDGLKEQVRTVDLSNGVLNRRIAELEARKLILPPLAPENLASCLDGYERWLIAITFRDTWNACLAEVVRMNAAGIGKGE